MAPNTPTAATTEPTTTGREALDNTEATTQPTASVTTHSVEEAVQAQGQPPMPPTTIGTEFSAEDIPAFQARSDAIFEAIISSLRAAKDASDAQTRDAILLNMAKTTSDLLVAGPRADHDQGNQSGENGPAPSETTHSVDKLDDKKSEPSDAAAEHKTDYPAEEPPKSTTEAEEQPALVPLTEFVNAQLAPEATTAPEPALQPEVPAAATEQAQQPQAEPSSRTIRPGAANYQFRGRGRAFQMRTNATPRPAYHPQPDNNDLTPSPEAEPQAKAEDSTESVKAPTDADTQPETTNSVEPPQAVETPDAPTKANDGFCNSFFPSQERPATSAVTTHSVEAPQAPAAPVPTPPAATGDEDLVPAQPLLDLSVLPGYPAKEEVLCQMNRCFTEEVRGAETILKVHEQLLSSTSVPEPQQTGFGFNRLLQDGRPSGHIWDPPTTCDGQGENCHRFHQSLLVFRIIIKTTWNRYTVISTSPQLQDLLDHVLTLHVRCFAQMILLVYAVRLGNQRGQMKPILHFIRDMLKTTEFAFKILYLLNHYYKKMTIGLSDREDPRPNGDDFNLAAQYWLCYCHRAFASFIEGLSGFLSWNTGDWLQTEELDAHLRTAIREKILTPAPQLLQQLRDRAYRQYVLLRIQALERNDVSYRWIRLFDAPKDDGTNDYLHVKRIIGKNVLFVSEDLFELPITKLLNKDVQLVRIDSTNRASVLGTIRSYLPGQEMQHAVFWFGRQYINNGNEDYGNVIAEICFHYTTFFGRVRQSVILPPYNRVHRQVWIGQVLCFYTQKDRIAPHAQDVLNSYDARLWFEDQRLLDDGQDLRRWKNSNQDADGAFYKAGSFEFRKHHLREYRQIKLWSWYQVHHVGENPPTDQRRAPRRPATPLITPHSGDGDSRQQPQLPPRLLQQPQLPPRLLRPLQQLLTPPDRPARTLRLISLTSSEKGLWPK
ncbi:hypothetical protein AAVH_32297 [Aphelenchoides avenae]|nr:hypothetical protein AAVH_32297 [Aphelenchus avenae]